MKKNKMLFLFLALTSPIFVLPLEVVNSHEDTLGIIDAKGLKQLEFNAVIEALDSTYTSLGTAKLKALTQPLCSEGEIIKRQAIISGLETGAVSADIRSTLSKMRLYEPSVIKYSNKLNELFYKVNGFYYTWLLRKGNTSSHALNLAYWGKLLGTTGMGVCLTSGAYVINHLTDSLFLPGGSQRGMLSWVKKVFWPGDIVKGFSSTTHYLKTNQQINNYAESLEKCKSVFGSSDTTAGDKVNALLIAAARSQGVATPGDDTTNIIQAFKAAHPYQYHKYRALGGFEANMEPASRLATVAMVATAFCFSAYDIIASEHELWAHVNELCSWMFFVRKLHDQLDSLDVDWEQADRLNQLLNDHLVSDFSNATYAFYNSWGRSSQWMHDPGKVLQIHHLAKKAAPLLEQMRHVIGEIDAYASVSQAKKRLDLCHVVFVESAHTMVSAQGLWSLALSKVNAVTNDVDLGVASANKMMLTGPNGGGKSTVMKSVGQAIVLAQSWGIVPADSFEVSMIDRIITAIDPQQSIKADLSTFMHELLQIKETLSLLATYELQGKRCLVLIDEPCRGTIELEAAQRVSKLCADLNECSCASVILATHLYEPAYTVQNMPGWSSWQLGYSFEGKKVCRTFKLLPGTAHWWFTDAVKRSQFLHSLETGISSH